MEDQEILNSYIPLVDFLADVCGQNCEVVLHDVSNPDHSVIAIRNGFHSGRKLGSSITDLALEIYSKKCYAGRDYLCNYRGYSHGKEFVSSSYYIKNKGKLIGMLCINKDTTIVKEFQNKLNDFINGVGFINPCTDISTPEVSENLNTPVVSMLHSFISNAINETNIPPQRMTIAEKVALVHKLNDQGILMLKGSVSEIADQLNVSEPTVYRYLNRPIPNKNKQES